MDEATVIEICRNAIVTLIMVAGPSLVIMMVVGTTISVFQTVSQINEQTLAMVPKLVVVFASSILLMPFMLGEMREYFEREIMDRIVAMGSVEGGANVVDKPVAGPVTRTPVPLQAPPSRPAANGNGGGNGTGGRAP